MCGIFLYSGCVIRGTDKKIIEKAFQKIAHRGPDESIIKYYGLNTAMGFHRLAIMDPTHAGMQPFEDPSKRYKCVVNGEIYNYKELQLMVPGYEQKSNSDCEVIVSLFASLINSDIDANISNKMHFVMHKLCNMIDGEYAFIIYDSLTEEIYAAVDELRIRPLFINFYENQLVVSSEIKAIVDIQHEKTKKIIALEPGHFCIISNGNYINEEYTNYYKTPQINISREDAAVELRKLLIENTRKKLNPERDFAFLLSGGLDSSLICSIASTTMHGFNKRIRTFTVAFDETATDLLAARKVAKHINSIHTEIIITVEEGINEIPEVIYYNESWDQTTTRASVPMRLAVKKIKELHPEIAVIYSGEIADELFQGYLYNLNAPSAQAGREDTIKRLKNITYSDGLRADRMVSSVGCELRLPFFGKDLLKFVLSLPPEYLNPADNNMIEKWLLRTAFSNFDKLENTKIWLPEEILWRTKNAMSDATSTKSSWKDSLKQAALNETTEERLRVADKLYPHSTPKTREDLWYREIFDKYYQGLDTIIPFKWMPSWAPPDLLDSSATALDVFSESDF